MGEPLDPELARALREPARLVRADPRLLDLVRAGGAPAREQLRTQASGADTAEDRCASAALLASLFGDRGPLDQAARGHGTGPPRELVALADVAALRPALRTSLASPVLTGLLEWATRGDAADPPLELAMAARDLRLGDAAVLRSVATRAEQLAAQSATRGQRPPLQRLAEVLRHTAEAGPGAGGGTDGPPRPSQPASRDAEPPRPGQHGPGAGDGAPAGATEDGGPSGSAPAGPDPRETASEGTTASDPEAREPDPTRRGPRVTTEGIPAAEMLGPDELNAPDPYSPDYPGTGVPVRDSISGPRPGTGTQPPGPGGPSGARDPGDPGTADDADPSRPGAPGSGPPGGPHARGGPPVPRVPSTSEQYYGAGSDRYAGHDPHSPQARENDRHVLRNWGITFLVIVAVIILLTLLL